MDRHYKVVTARSEEELSQKVTELLREGWTCNGGLVSYMELHRIYAQAMVKEDVPVASATTKKKSGEKP